jgi:glutamine cyclotransferase
MFNIKTIIILLITGSIAACNAFNREEEKTTAQNEEVAAGAPETINFYVVNRHPHDTTAFTEGFLMYEGALYESTGSPENMPQTRSLIGVVDLQTGAIDKKAELDRHKYFGEGISFLNNKLYQLTYQTKVGFIYDARTFKQTGTFPLPVQEGWGMTTDGTHLILSDGTSNLTYLDSATLKPVKTLSVKDNNVPVDNVNELEYINGFIYANVYTTANIIKIDPANGRVVGKIDLSSLVAEATNKFPGSLEMNGIAYDSTTKKIYVTGKLWPHIYEISFPH